jgi:DNA-binding transcriptional regulator YiaG
VQRLAIILPLPPPRGTVALLGIAQRTIHASRTHIPINRKGQTLVSTKPKTLGDHIKAARFIKGLCQVQLAKTLGVGLISLRRWERNEQEPKPDQLAALARTLDLSEPQTQHQGDLLGIYPGLPRSPVAVAQIAEL